jgi:PAS domain S-box-containing protein
LPSYYWTETHPELAIEPATLSVLEKHDGLMRLLLDPSDAERVKAGVVLRQELAALEASKALLRKSEQQLGWLAAIVQSSDDAILSLSLDGIITSWNAGAARLYNYPPEEVIGKPITILIPQERQDEELTIIRRVRRGDHIEHYETVRRRRDGKLLDVSLTVSPVRDAQGNVVGASKIARNITERKQEVEFLRRQADLLDQSHDAIFTWKIGGGIAYWSKGAERLYGYTAEEAIGRISHELLRTRSHVPMQEIERQIAREGSWLGELSHTTRGGRTVMVESRHVRVEYSGQTYALETNRDITERKAHEEYVRLLTREVNHRAKNMLSVVRVIANQTASASRSVSRRFQPVRTCSFGTNGRGSISRTWFALSSRISPASSTLVSWCAAPGCISSQRPRKPSGSPFTSWRPTRRNTALSRPTKGASTSGGKLPPGCSP